MFNPYMFVKKRNNTLETFSVIKITERIDRLRQGVFITKNSTQPAYNLPSLDIVLNDVVHRVSSGVCDGITTVQIDDLSAEVCASMSTIHPDYGTLAARLTISNLHKQTKNTFEEKIEILHKKGGIIPKDVYLIMVKHKDLIHATIDYKSDYTYNYFGIRTLMKSYLLSYKNEIVERPQDMLMRVAIGIHKEDIDSALETYTCMSKRMFTHATPTLFNAGTVYSQMSSCFLLDMQADSINGIYNTIHQCALISKNSGGIGVHIHKIRSSGSKINGTGGISNGIVPMLKVFDSTAKYVDQGGNKRPGSIAVYLEPWHPDIFEFLELRKNTGKDEIRARDLFLGLWIPDLFMERVQNDGDWSMFCPNDVYKKVEIVEEEEEDKENVENIKKHKKEKKYKEVGLQDVYGDEFKEMYESFEAMGIARKTVKAQILWKAIIGGYKDHCNRKNNQSNLGTLKGSNLCTEILQYTSPEEIAVCNLASIALPVFIKEIKDGEDGEDKGINKGLFKQVYKNENGTFTFDYDELRRTAGIITKNLNRVIDGNFYPVPEAETSNKNHRPVGIGIQGLADVFAILRLPFESDEAKIINKRVFEAIYYGALEMSCKIAKEEGTYSSYEGSPMSQGKLQFDLWGVKETGIDWSELREQIKLHGVRNSLLIAPMPTASTSQILGFNECIEPFTSNIYTRRTLAGEFQVVNSYLLKDLIKRNLWSHDMKTMLIEHEGSVQNIAGIPKEIKEMYKTAWEMKMKNILEMAVDRSPFIDQSQSLNLFVPEPTYSKLTSMHFYGWKNGLRTGMYYLRTKPITTAIKFTVDREIVERMSEREGGEIESGAVCEMLDGCLSCSG